MRDDVLQRKVFRRHLLISILEVNLCGLLLVFWPRRQSCRPSLRSPLLQIDRLARKQIAMLVSLRDVVEIDPYTRTQYVLVRTQGALRERGCA